MINRNLIRIRVIQVVYSWYQNTTKDLQSAEKELMNGMQKSYDLYYYMLLLMVQITKTYEDRVEAKRSRLMPSPEDLNPNMRLIDNKFIRQLRTNVQFNKYLAERPMLWDNNNPFVKNLLDAILASDVYKEYSENDAPTYEADKEFWRKTFKQFIYLNEELDALLEDECIYWNDDVEIVQGFVMKTIKRFSREAGTGQELLPMFKDDEDRQYAIKLLHDTLLNEKEYRMWIEQNVDKWDFDRISFMDLVIMQTALAEIVTFKSIPISVSLNEYIEIAKSYSTPKSGLFINGILDAIVAKLKAENRIIK